MESLCELEEEVVNWRQKVPRAELKRMLLAPLGEKAKKEMGAVTQEYPKGDPQILKEYWNLQDIFRKRGSDALPRHCPMDCSIEILPGAKLPKPRLYSMTTRELKELCSFIDKNLKRGFMKPARPWVLFWEKKDGTLLRA